jgi:hypothetical protein
MPLNNDDIKQLINILQKALVEDQESTPEQEINTERDSIHTKPDTRKIAGPRKNTKVANRQDSVYNKFESMPERNMHKDDTKIDKMLSQYSPTQRTREFNLMDVVCRVCGKHDSINPALAYDSGNRYKCNKCSKIPG